MKLKTQINDRKFISRKSPVTENNVFENSVYGVLPMVGLFTIYRVPYECSRLNKTGTMCDAMNINYVWRSNTAALDQEDSVDTASPNSVKIRMHYDVQKKFISSYMCFN